MRRSAIIFSLIFLSTSAQAQTDCSTFLRYDTISYENDITLTLAILRTFTQENFQEKKNEFSGGLTMPVEGIPIEAFANYSEFNQSRQRVFSHFEYDLSLDQTEKYLSSRVSNASLEAVKQCLASQFGLHAALDSVTNDRIDISVYWRPTPGSDATIDPLQYVITGGQLIATPSSSINANTWQGVALQRDVDSDLTFRAQGGGAVSEVIVVPAVPTVDPQPYTWTFGNSQAPLRFDPDKWDSNIVCHEGAVISGQHQNGSIQEDSFGGRTHVTILPRHSINPDGQGWHYSRVQVNGSLLLSQASNTPLGYRLNTIRVTCNP